MDSTTEKDRHPIRFLLKLLIFAGLLYAVGRFLAQQKEEWAGLTESQVKAKMEEKLTPKVGEEKASEIAVQVTAALTERGVIAADEPDAADEPAEDEE